MVYPPYAAPFPDSKPVDVTLGTQQRAMLSLMAAKPGTCSRATSWRPS
jgi:hypothetical protein